MLIKFIKYFIENVNMTFLRPFKRWFNGTLLFSSGYYLNSALQMQEYYVENNSEVSISKLQAVILWIYNLNIWHFFSTFINNISFYIGVSKLIVSFCILFLIFYIFVKIYFKIKQLFDKYILPKKQETQKKNMELLEYYVNEDTKNYKEYINNKLLEDYKKVQEENKKLKAINSFIFFNDPKLYEIELYLMSYKTKSFNDKNVGYVKNFVTKDEILHVQNELIKHNKISLQELKDFNINKL